MKKILFVLGFGLTFALVSCNFQPDEIPLPPATEGNDTVETVATDDENTDTETEIVIENDDVVEEVDDENETEGNTISLSIKNNAIPRSIKINDTKRDLIWENNKGTFKNYSNYPFKINKDNNNIIIVTSKNLQAKIENECLIINYTE